MRDFTATYDATSCSMYKALFMSREQCIFTVLQSVSPDFATTDRNLPRGRLSRDFTRKNLRHSVSRDRRVRGFSDVDRRATTAHEMAFLSSSFFSSLLFTLPLHAQARAFSLSLFRSLSRSLALCRRIKSGYKG